VTLTIVAKRSKLVALLASGSSDEVQLLLGDASKSLVSSKVGAREKV